MTTGHTRRGALRAGGGALLALGACRDRLDLGLKEGDSFDEVLDRIHTTDPEFDGGGANHAPMAAEALVSMGRADRVVAFVERYAERLDLMAPAPPLGPGARASALGVPAQRAAWVATYVNEMQSQSAQQILIRDWALLCPGFAAAGFHGILRVAHAVRSLGREDTPSRRRELGHALGYWAARFRILPGTPGARTETGLDVVKALEGVPMVPGSQRRNSGLIIDQLIVVEKDPAFAAHVEKVDLDALPIDRALTELTAASARLFLIEGASDFSYLHGITGVSALRLVFPWLDDAARRQGLGYAFQCLAAVHATHGSAQGIPAWTPGKQPEIAVLSGRAGASNDEHSIKLAEAVLREYAVDPRPEYLEVAAAWLG